MQKNEIPEGQTVNLDELESGTLNANATQTADSKPTATGYLATYLNNFRSLSFKSSQPLLPLHVQPVSNQIVPGVSITRQLRDNRWSQLIVKSLSSAVNIMTTVTPQNAQLQQNDALDALDDIESQQHDAGDERVDFLANAINPDEVVQVSVMAQQSFSDTESDTLSSQADDEDDADNQSVLPDEENQREDNTVDLINEPVQVNDTMVEDDTHSDDTASANAASRLVNTPVENAEVVVEVRDPLHNPRTHFELLQVSLRNLLQDADFITRTPLAARDSLQELSRCWAMQGQQFFQSSPTTVGFQAFKRETQKSLAKVQQELWAHRTVWQKYLMPIVNLMLSLFVRLEKILNVPSRYQPTLYKASVAEVALQDLHPKLWLDQTCHQTERCMSAG